MNKEFIPYNLALELKELGFDEMCMGKFIPYFSESGWLLEINERLHYSTNSLLEQGFSAPLYQQTFRWFREKYGLDCFIDRGGIKGIYHAFVGGSEHGFLYGNNRNSPSEFTYEEAEIACLEKLIEIVKENKK